MTCQDLLRPRELQPEVRRQAVGFVVLLVESSDLIGEGEGIGHITVVICIDGAAVLNIEYRTRHEAKPTDEVNVEC